MAAITNEEEFLRDIVLINTIFCLDLKEVGKILMHNPSNQTWCRIFVRTCLSYTESICCKLAEGLYSILKKSRAVCPEEIGFKVDREGGLHWREGKIEKRIMKVVRCWIAFAGGTSLDLEKFEARLVGSVQVRHRITHPKTAKDLLISPSDINMVADSTKDFRDFIDLTKRDLTAFVDSRASKAD